MTLDFPSVSARCIRMEDRERGQLNDFREQREGGEMGRLGERKFLVLVFYGCSMDSLTDSPPPMTHAVSFHLHEASLYAHQLLCMDYCHQIDRQTD